jgi:hypothetical protein
MTKQREHTCRILEAVSLLLGAAFTVVIMLYASCWKFELSLLYLWALFPYVAFFALSRFVGRFGSLAAGAGCIAAVVMLAFTVFVYGDSMFFNLTSTAALIFLFFPLYLLVGGPVIFGIALGVGRLIRRHGHEGT